MSGPYPTYPSSADPRRVCPTVRGWLRRRREMRRRRQEIVGFMWVWDGPMEMTREIAEWTELHMLPFGVSILNDRRKLLDSAGEET